MGMSNSHGHVKLWKVCQNIKGMSHFYGFVTFQAGLGLLCICQNIIYSLISVPSNATKSILKFDLNLLPFCTREAILSADWVTMVIFCFIRFYCTAWGVEHPDDDKGPGKKEEEQQ